MQDKFFKEFNQMLANLPAMVENPLAPLHINADTPIYKGDFRLKLVSQTIDLSGEIYFSFKPHPGVRFKGNSNYYNVDFDVLEIEVPGASFRHGQAMISHIGGTDHLIRGFINNPVVFFLNSTEAKELTFSLPNFENIGGLPVRSGTSMMANRITLEDTDWSIVLDQVPSSSQMKKELRNEGGYGFNYNGRLIHKSKTFGYESSVDTIGNLGLFLTFLNGRRCYPAMIQAKHNEQICWNDYSSWHADTYKEEASWLPQNYVHELSDLWKNFHHIVQGEDDRECLDFLIHWYVEANYNSGFAEGAVVFLQNAFELLFNWQIVEKNALFTAKQAYKMPAADKLRILMTRASIPLDFPTKYHNVIRQLNQQGLTVKDFPELFTMMRNTIVHANDGKRKKLKLIPSMARFHIRHMGIHCLELLILHTLGYMGKYANRTSENMWRGGNDELVPWIVTSP